MKKMNEKEKKYKNADDTLNIIKKILDSNKDVQKKNSACIKSYVRQKVKEMKIKYIQSKILDEIIKKIKNVSENNASIIEG